MSDPLSALRAVGGAEPTQGAGLPNIPAVPFTNDYALANFLQSAKLWMEKAKGEGLTGFATKADLVRNKVLATDENGNIIPGTGGGETPNLAIPPVPTGLTASGAMTSILVAWDDPTQAYGNHGYTEVWAAETDDFTGAVMIGESGGVTFAHAVGEDSTRYYWLRFVSTAGIKGPYNGVAGTKGQTAKNPQYLLDTLTGKLTESQLYADLNARIDLIDGPSTTIGTIPFQLAQLQGQIDELANTPDYDNAATYATGDVVKYNGAIYKAEQTTTGNLPTDTTYWLKIGDYSSLADAVAAHSVQIATLTTNDAAQASQITTLQATVETNYGTLQSSLQTEQTTRANADRALSQQITTLTATVNNNQTSLNAAIQNEQTARADADSALTLQVNTAYSAATKTRTYSQNTAPTTGMLAGDLWFDADDGYKAYRYNGTQWVATDDTRIAGNVAAVQTLARTVAGPDGATAQYTVKVDANGHVAGFGLSSESNAAGASTSEFMVVADKFSIAPVASNPTANDGAPFFHLTAPTVIDGVTVPAGTYLKTAYIADASITNAKIGNLSADKITSGQITAERIDGTNLSVVNGTFSGVLSGARGTFSGSLDAADGTFRGSLSAATGTFGGTLLAGVLDLGSAVGTTFSYNYAAGTFNTAVPADKTSMRVTLVGAGGGGGGGSGNDDYSSGAPGACGGGGGAGNVLVNTFHNLTPGVSVSAVVGAGGAGGWIYGSNGTAGASGGASVVYVGGSEFARAAGGAGGGGANDWTPGAGGEKGGQPGGLSGGSGGSGGGSVYGSGGAGGTGWGAVGGAGGIGAGGGGGAGMSDGYAHQSGGNGGRGMVLIEFFNPNSVVLRTEYNTLLQALTRQGIQTS